MFLSDKKTFAPSRRKCRQNAAFSGCRQRLGGAFPFQAAAPDNTPLRQSFDTIAAVLTSAKAA
jgi:hypothetical protein